MIANQRKLGHAALTSHLRGAGSWKTDRLKGEAATAVLRTYDGTSLRFVMTAPLRGYDSRPSAI